MHSRASRQLALLVAALVVAVALPAEASAARYGSRTLKVGARGGDVKQLQRYLGSAGHRVARDGDFGPRTLRALRSTESELELRADGVATVREQRAIKLAVNDLGPGGAAYVASASAGEGRAGSDGVGHRGRLRGPAGIGAKGREKGDRRGQRDRARSPTSGAAATGAGTTTAMTARAPSPSPCTARACSTARWSQATSRAGVTPAGAAGSRSTPTPTTSTWWLQASASTRAHAPGPAHAGPWRDAALRASP